MATGRTLQKHYRFYADGYDLSGFGRSIGPFGITADEADMTVWTDTVKGYLPNHIQVDLGTFNGIFDNTATTGLHALASTSGVQRTALVAMGIRAAPVAGDPCFGGQFLQTGYTPEDDGGAVSVTIPFAGWSGAATSLLYAPGFGQLLHASGAETAVNAAVGHDGLTGAATTTGGYMLYHVLASSNAAHTATLKVQDSATNADDASFADVTGATTGVITVTAGVSGIVALTPGATVRRYLRWQIVLGTATSVTFVLSFHRG
jgi:hypothetical protein